MIVNFVFLAAPEWRAHRTAAMPVGCEFREEQRTPSSCCCTAAREIYHWHGGWGEQWRWQNIELGGGGASWGQDLSWGGGGNGDKQKKINFWAESKIFKKQTYKQKDICWLRGGGGGGNWGSKSKIWGQIPLCPLVPSLEVRAQLNSKCAMLFFLSKFYLNSISDIGLLREGEG